jgi:hypothetical protein
MKTWYDNPSNRIENYVLADGQSGTGQTQTQCMKNLGEPSGDQLTKVHELEATQRMCIYKAKPWAGYEDLFDPSTHMWFSWRWKNWPNYLDPNQDPSWKIPDLPPDSGIRVRIKSVANQQYMTAPGGLVPDGWVYNKPGTPLDFIFVGTKDNGVFRLTQEPSLFLSYRLIDGPVKLYKPYNLLDPTSYFTDGPSNFQITRWNQSREWSIQSIPWRELGDVGYMWYYDGY